jgi:hypothetical protein
MKVREKQQIIVTEKYFIMGLKNMIMFIRTKDINEFTELRKNEFKISDWEIKDNLISRIDLTTLFEGSENVIYHTYRVTKVQKQDIKMLNLNR